MQKIFLFGLIVLTSALLPAQTPTTTSVFFELDKFDLSDKARQTLDALALQLLEAPDYSVNIDAYTDGLGTSEYNLRLAADRAAVVQNYLSAKGILPGKIAAKNWGERNLVYDNATEENRQKNRRVDISATLLFFSDMAALRNRLSANGEHRLIVQPDREQQVTTARGTIVVVPAQSFVFEDGAVPTGPVELTVKEAFTFFDFLSQNLSTTSDGQLLQTGGMVYIGAQSEGRPLSLADGAALTVAIPAGNVDPGMELFYGQQDGDGDINWQPAQQAFRQTLQINQIALDIDPSLGKRIMAMRVPLHPKPAVPEFADALPPEPREFNAPRPPNPPEKPRWDDAKRMFGSRAGETMSRKNAKKAEKYYRKAIAKYERDSAAYVVLHEKHLAKQIKYEAAIARFDGDHRNWELAVKSRIRAIMDFEREQCLYNYTNSLQLALKQIGKNIGQRRYYTRLEYAIRDAAEKNLQTRLKKHLMNQARDRIIIGDLYYKFIGQRTVDGNPNFNRLYQEVRDLYPPDTTDRLGIRILKDLGIRAVSDSLRMKYWEKSRELDYASGEAYRYMNAYVADITRLGWINCDKFYNEPGERVQLVVNEPEIATMYVVCKDINSVLTFNPNGQGAYIAAGLPRGRKVSIVSIKLKDGRAQYAVQETKAGESGALTMNYRSVSLKELREELRNL